MAEEELKYVNLTNTRITTYKGGVAHRTFEPAPFCLMVKQTNTPYERQKELDGIPLATATYEDIELVGAKPETVEGDAFIVSKMVGEVIGDMLYDHHLTDRYPWLARKLVVGPDTGAGVVRDGTRIVGTTKWLVYYDGRDT
jgi:hypothetical protein